MILIIANYRTGSTTFAKELGGTGAEYLQDHIYKPPNSIWEDGKKFLPVQHVYKIMNLLKKIILKKQRKYIIP